MKKKFLIILGIVLVALIALLFWFRHYTKSHSPNAVVTSSINGADINVNYCQPYKKGRLIFGSEESGALQPYGKYWRVGANEATLFSTTKNLLVNNQPLKAGKYSLYAYPGKDTWEIMLNSDFDRWGMPAPEPEMDVVKTTVAASNDAPLAEQLHIELNTLDSTHLNMVLHWDQTMVTIPITVE